MSETMSQTGDQKNVRLVSGLRKKNRAYCPPKLREFVNVSRLTGGSAGSNSEGISGMMVQQG